MGFLESNWNFSQRNDASKGLQKTGCSMPSYDPSEAGHGEAKTDMG
jgi:hypothetical protein